MGLGVGVGGRLVAPLRLLQPLRAVLQPQSLGRVRKQRVPREVVCVGLDAW